jgi:hypothetical protein
MDVGVVLAEKIGKEPMVVEVEFERIFGGWLRNGLLSLVPSIRGMEILKAGSARPSALRGS